MPRSSPRTRLNAKRPPPSPIVAPPPADDEEERASGEEEDAGEPPAKVARRLELGGDEEGTQEATAAAVEDDIQEGTLPAEGTGGPSLPSLETAAMKDGAIGEEVPAPPPAVKKEKVGEEEEAKAKAHAMRAEGATEEVPPTEGVPTDPAALERAMVEGVMAAAAAAKGAALEGGIVEPLPSPRDEPPNLPLLSPVVDPPSQNNGGDGAMPWARIVGPVIIGDGDADKRKDNIQEETNEAAVPADGADEAANEESESATVAKKVDVILDACIGGDAIKGVPTPAELTEDQKPASKPKKARKEFTAQEKLHILSELNGPNPPSAAALRQKYGVSKSSLHRWRQPEKLERLEEMARGTAASAGAARRRDHGLPFAIEGDRSKKRDMNDKLSKIKAGLRTFCERNLALPEDERLAITSSLVQLKAAELRDELLESHRKIPGLLPDDEAAAIEAFKGSKSWACLVGNQLGFLTAAAGSIVWSDAARDNTVAYLERNARAPPKPKKQRMEFTAREKVAILRELEDANARNRADGAPPVTVEQICAKYCTSKSSLHRWKQQYRTGRLQELAEAGSGYCHAKRVFNDKLYVIKKALNEFYVENEKSTRVTISYMTLQRMAITAKEGLLQRHHAAVADRDRRRQQDEGMGAAVQRGEAVAGIVAQQSEASEGAVVQQVEAEASGGVVAQQGEAGDGIAADQGDTSEGVVSRQTEAVEGVVSQRGEANEDAAAQKGEACEGVVAQKGEACEGVVAQEGEAAIAQQGKFCEGEIESEGKVSNDEGREQREGEAAGQAENARANSSGSSSDILSKEEVHALENFKASNSWLRQTATKFGWKLDVDVKKEEVDMSNMGVVDGMVGPGAYLAGAVYHPPDHPGREEHPRVVLMGQPIVETHVTQEHPDVVQKRPGIHHQAGGPGAPQDHPSEEHHHHVAVAQDQPAMAMEQGHVSGMGEGDHFASEIEEYRHVNNQHQQRPQEGHHEEKLAPSDMAEMLEDPLVHVEDALGHHGNSTADV